MRILACILMSVVIMTSCKMSAFKNGVKGNGQSVSSEIKIDDYNSIEIGGKFDLVYEQKADQAPYLRIEIDENLREYVSATVADGKLTIRTTQEINPKHYKIYTNSTALSDLSVSGLNNIELKDSINSENLHILVSEMGDIKAENLYCQNLNINMSGLANITLAGEAANTKIDVSGKANVKAYDLKSKNVDCAVLGMGNIYIYASEILSAQASGMGDINYKGSPKETNLSKSGMADIASKD